MSREVLTVLVVDDELPLRQELRLFPWEAHGFELVGEAENGEEALRFCRHFSPDIVLTDITMPVMDGLSMYRRLSAEFPLTQVILLTCHSDFAYAREAIQLGATEYLVKVTMEERELERALNKARAAHTKAVSLCKKDAEERRWRLSMELIGLAEQAESGESQLNRFLEEDFGFKAPFCLAAIHVEAHKEIVHSVKRVTEEALTRLEKPQHPYQWLPAKDGVYLLLFEQEGQPASTLRSRLELITAALYEAVEQQLYPNSPVRIYAVVSEPLADTRQFAAMYRLVTEEHPLRFYDLAGKVFVGGKLAVQPQLSDASVAEMAEKLRSAKGDRSKLAHCLQEELSPWAIKQRLAPEVLKSLVLDWRRLWVSAAAEDSIKKRAETTNAILKARTLSELIAVVVHEVESGDGPKAIERTEIMEAKAYIAAHLDQPITLSVVAEQVHLSTHYLSRLFREETGKTFNDYVTRQRMERAIELLQTTTMRVYEVAVAVGIPSYRYFSSIFREFTGASPTDFKRG